MDRIIVFTNGARGAGVLAALAEAGHGIADVIVPAAKAPHGAVAETCTALGLTPRPVTDVNDAGFVAALVAARPELLVVAGYPTIFRRPLMESAARGVINLHGGRLPEYRGGSPLNWQMINGEATAVISVVAMDEGLDTGPVLAETDISIGDDDTIADLHDKANAAWPELVVEVVAGLDAGPLKGRVQDESRAAYWHQRGPEDSRIDWPAMTARQVRDLVRALAPLYSPAFTLWDGRRVTIATASVPAETIRGTPGRVCYAGGRGPYVVCRDRAVLLGIHDVEGGGRLHAGARLGEKAGG